MQDALTISSAKGVIAQTIGLTESSQDGGLRLTPCLHASGIVFQTVMSETGIIELPRLHGVLARGTWRKTIRGPILNGGS